MNKHNLSTIELNELIKIAQNNIPALVNRSDLEQRFNDSEDFYDIAVWCLKDALIAAYELGRKNLCNKE